MINNQVINIIIYRPSKIPTLSEGEGVKSLKGEVGRIRVGGGDHRTNILIS